MSRTPLIVKGVLGCSGAAGNFPEDEVEGLNDSDRYHDEIVSHPPRFNVGDTQYHIIYLLLFFKIFLFLHREFNQVKIRNE